MSDRISRPSYGKKALQAARMLALSTIALVMPLSEAWAQRVSTCSDRAHVGRLLKDDFGETVAWRALSRAGTVVEILSNDETRTWTIIVSTPQGLTCLVAAGQDWEIITGEPLESGKKGSY